MTQTDRFDYPISTPSAAAAEHYRNALDLLFCMRASARQEIEAALQHDPDFALAHCVKARVEIIEGDTPGARASAAHGLALAADATPREQQHALLVDRVTRNDNDGTLAQVLEHAQAYPRDALPLSFALGVYSLLGFGGFTDHRERQVALLESVAPAWPQDWWLQGWLGWSYAEVGEVSRGVPLLDESLAARPDNANTAHGRAHAYYEAGDLEGGKQFLEAWMPGYYPNEPLHCHVAWHLALLHLQEGDFTRAHDLYESHIRPSVSQALPMFTHIDCAAFAWRSELCGRPLSTQLLAEIYDFAQANFNRPGIPFVNWHTALSLLTGAPAQVREFADQVTAQAAQADALVMHTSAQLCTALAELAEGDCASAADRILDALDDTACIGGSNAQRDGVINTGIAALVMADRMEEATSLNASRSAQRAAHMDGAWLQRLVQGRS